jgi:hypothetical protein
MCIRNCGPGATYFFQSVVQHCQQLRVAGRKAGSRLRLCLAKDLDSLFFSISMAVEAQLCPAYVCL